jgi:opacity protein-like surface antigen
MNSLKISVVFVFLLSVNIIVAQPKLTCHAYGGYSQPLPNLKGDIPLNEGDNNYQMSYGYNFGIDGKYAVDKSYKIKITASVNYNLFRNSGDIPIAENGNQTIKMNILTGGIGAEYSFLPKNQINPFIGAEFTGSLFNGINIEQIGDTTHTESNLKSESRFGFLINAGVEVISSRNIGVVAGIRYNLANLIVKDSASVSESQYALWDSEYTYNGNTIKAKNIQFLQFYAGISFYLMHPKTKTKK